MKQFKAFIITLAMGMCFVAGVATSQEETTSSAAEKTPINTDTRLGTPVHTETRDGIRVEVWLVTHDMYGVTEAPKDKSAVNNRKSTDDLGREQMEREPNKNMPEKNPSAQKTPPNGKKVHTPGTPEVVIVKISEVSSNKAIEDAAVDLKVTSPSGKASTVLLDYEKDEYVQKVKMTEKGTYTFELKVTRDGKTTSMYFTSSVPAS